MPASRRDFLRQSAAFATAFSGLHLLSDSAAKAATSTSFLNLGYGPLVTDPKGLLDLPRGFAYKIISRKGETMDDGLLVPGAPDGMATFPLPDGSDDDICILMRNHELAPSDHGAFGGDYEHLDKVDKSLLYDRGDNRTPGSGGVSTIVYNVKKQRVEKEFLALGGTIRNCSGGPTPWGSWITCEEANELAGVNEEKHFTLDAGHGYAFEVPATAEVKMTKAIPLRAMGRFRREAVAIDPRTGIVYQTEDMHDGLIYRFIPNVPGKLIEGGRLQALAIRDQPSLDSRNWNAPSGAGQTVSLDDKLPVEWIDMDDVEAPKDDLRKRGYKAGATRFARGEGIWYAEGSFYWACTNGGEKQLGQLWRYTPSASEGHPAEPSEPGTLELFIEPNNAEMVKNADNLTAAPWGDLIVCEDRQEPTVRLVGVTPQGECYTLADNNAKCEFAGVCFSPDGSTLFVNIQAVGLTVAITGPWRAA